MKLSLRKRIVLGTTVALSVVVLLGSIAVWLAAHSLLYQTLDKNLRAQASALVNRNAQQPGPPPGFSHEHQRPNREGRPPRPPMELPPPPEFNRQNGRSFVQIIQRSDGKELIRSPSLPTDMSLYALIAPPIQYDRPLTVYQSDGHALRLIVVELNAGNGSSRLPSWLKWIHDEPESLPDRPHPADASGTAHVLLLAIDADSTISDERRLAYVLAFLWTLTTCLGAVVAGWLQRTLLRPIDRLSLAITEIDPANLHARVAMDGVPDEMRVVIERLNELIARLEAAFTRERGTIASIAHELRTPVTGLLMTLELELARQSASQSASHPAAVATCFRIATSMQGMITHLLAMARSDAGQIPCKQDPCDLPVLVRDCWNIFEIRAAEKNVCVNWTLPETCIITSDSDHLRMVVSNLIDNAVSYTPAGGGIHVSLTVNSTFVELVLRNHTDGTVLDCSQIFQPFWRGDAARSGGLHCGLGLALVQRLMTRLGGSVHAESTVQEFIIRMHIPTR